MILNSNYDYHKQRKMLIRYYHDIIRPYETEIKNINNKLSSGFYIGDAYYNLGDRKIKLRKKILRLQEEFHKLILEVPKMSKQ